MNYLQDACRLNNEGALMLSSCDQKTPLKYFKKGLQCLQTSCTQAAQQEEGHITPKDCSSLRPLMSLRKSVAVRLPMDRKKYDAQMLQQQSCGICDTQKYSYIHTYACEVVVVEGEVTVEEQSLASAVLMYNYALCLHRKGEEHFDRALYLYNQSLKLLTHLDGCLAEINGMIVAILKNQADIYYRLNDFQSVQVVLNELLLFTHKLAVEDELAESAHEGDTIAPSA